MKALLILVFLAYPLISQAQVIDLNEDPLFDCYGEYSEAKESNELNMGQFSKSTASFFLYPTSKSSPDSFIGVFVDQRFYPNDDTCRFVSPDHPEWPDACKFMHDVSSVGAHHLTRRQWSKDGEDYVAYEEKGGGKFKFEVIMKKPDELYRHPTTINYYGTQYEMFCSVDGLG